VLATVDGTVGTQHTAHRVRVDANPLARVRDLLDDAAVEFTEPSGVTNGKSAAAD
jgi:hypothetical protein